MSLWLYYRVFHADRHKRNRHYSASRNDRKNLKKSLMKLKQSDFLCKQIYFYQMAVLGTTYRKVGGSLPKNSAPKQLRAGRNALKIT